MSADRFLVELCSRELEFYISYLFEKLPADDLAEIPIIGGIFLPWWASDVMQKRVLAALRAVERHRDDATARYQPLPIHETAIERLKDSDDHRHNLMGLYGTSMSSVEWGPHPSFRTFCCGVLADQLNTPEQLRTDPDLLQEFPPRKLKQLYHSVWWPMDTIESLRPHVAAYADSPEFVRFLRENLGAPAAEV